MDRSDLWPQMPIPAPPEKAYDLLTRYGFAQRYVEGKSVVCIGSEGLGYGVSLLTRESDSVVALSSNAHALDSAREYYPAPNATYQEADLPGIPYPDAHFDVVVAFETLEHLKRPEDLVEESKRVMKPDGVFVASTPDKQVHSNERNYRDPEHEKEMYIPEFREMLERHFEQVSVYGQGTVVGGMVFDPAGSLSAGSVESTDFLSPMHSLSADAPEAHYALAVCGSSASPVQQNGLPYLLLDRDRLIYEECDDQREDIQLLQAEIRQLQRTEVQAFSDTMRLRATEIGQLRAQLDTELPAQVEAHRRESKRLRERYEARIANLERHINEIESSRTWRMLGAYRVLRTKLGALARNK